MNLITGFSDYELKALKISSIRPLVGIKSFNAIDNAMYLLFIIDNEILHCNLLTQRIE